VTGGTAADELFPGDDPTSAAHRARDWAATPLGPVESWPVELRSAVRTLMPSRIPMLLWWSHAPCANAIEHGYRFAPGAITTPRAELRDDRPEIEVRDHGGWRASDPDGGTDRGRGRLIMARVMDEATIFGTSEGTTVRMVKRLCGGSLASVTRAVAGRPGPCPALVARPTPGSGGW
jgi:hypothetical protein